MYCSRHSDNGQPVTSHHELKDDGSTVSVHNAQMHPQGVTYVDFGARGTLPGLHTQGHNAGKTTQVKQRR